MDPSTQDFLEVKDVKDGVLLLKNNQMRGILMVSSINFGLRSEEAQNSIVFAFQSFLNSLDFYCQIIMQSRNINITPYIDTVKKLEENQTSELLKTQTASYREFIKELVKGENVVTKSFYVVVPYLLTEIMGVGGIGKQYGLSNLFSKKNSDHQTMSDRDFERCKDQLFQRMDFLADGLRRCGLDSAPLSSPEIIELLWAINHPSEAEAGYYPEIAPELLK